MYPLVWCHGIFGPHMCIGLGCHTLGLVVEMIFFLGVVDCVGDALGVSVYGA